MDTLSSLSPSSPLPIASPVSRSNSLECSTPTSRSWSKNSTLIKSGVYPSTPMYRRHFPVSRSCLTKSTTPQDVTLYTSQANGSNKELHLSESNSTSRNNLFITRSISNGVGNVVGMPNKREFIINQEWFSEAISVKRMNLKSERPPQTQMTRPRPQQMAIRSEKSTVDIKPYEDWPRRCRSAPPPGYRNPITWQ